MKLYQLIVDSALKHEPTNSKIKAYSDVSSLAYLYHNTIYLKSYEEAEKARNIYRQDAIRLSIMHTAPAIHILEIECKIEHEVKNEN